MRRPFTQTLLATLLVASAFSHAHAQKPRRRQRPSPPSVVAPVETPDPGRVEGGTYTNDFFGFSFTLPKDWAVLGAADNKWIMDKGKEAVGEGTSEPRRAALEASVARTQVLITVSKYPPGASGPGFNALLIGLAERIPTAIIKTGADYIDVTQRSLQGSAAKLELLGPIRTEKFGGAVFTVADVKTSSGPAIAAQRYFVRITKGHALAFVYTYYDEADLKALDGILATFNFK